MPEVPLGAQAWRCRLQGQCMPQACWRPLAPHLGLCCDPKAPNAAWQRCLYFVERQKMERLRKPIHVEEMNSQHIPGVWE